MPYSRHQLRFYLLCILVLIPARVFAHAEHDKERYVAVDGLDQGRCDQKESPCKTIAYAAKQAGKGDKILLAEGRYDITDVDSIFYLASSAVPVTGGYQKGSYKPAAPIGNTILVGVPPEFSQGLAEKGFTVITDTKGLNREQQQYLDAKQTQLEAMGQVQAAVPCVAGAASEFSCNNLDLLAHVPLANLGNHNSHGNDIWGHFDLNDNREYALVGLTNGVSIVEVTDPVNPRVVSFIASQNTTWRDLKTYQYFDEIRRRWMSYAYVTADAASVGTMILDLNQLPNKVMQVSSETTDTSAHNIYISNVDYSTGVALTNRTAYMHVAGSDKQGGAFNSYSLANPTNPTPVYKNAANSRSWYSHDVSSLWITDARREQCVDKNNDCDLMLDYNENEILLWDKTDSMKPFTLARSTYQYVSYVHSGWWTEDRQFISVHDELDEQRYNLNTRVRFFAINNLRAPELAGEYIGPTPAIDHNGYTRGNRYYISNYERGLVVLDISDPRNPVEAGFFDTYPLANSASFNGAWGTYPFLPSGNILVNDINSGLYVIRDNTAKVQGSVKFSEARVTVKEGEILRLYLQRIGNNSGAVEVFFETQAGNATAADFTAITGNISWLDGDSSEKIIEIPIVADGTGNEFTETFFVRLYNPRNGLVLASPSLAVVDIADKPDDPVVISSSSIASSADSVSSAHAGAAKKSGSGGSVPLMLMIVLGLLIIAKQKIAVKKYGSRDRA
ncbi:MAG: hypothetical protein K0Q67_727 [Cellvibrio sp.]|nr:hypothetical protein [Cellvibrio sp.]